MKRNMICEVLDVIPHEQFSVVRKDGMVVYKYVYLDESGWPHVRDSSDVKPKELIASLLLGDLKAKPYFPFYSAEITFFEMLCANGVKWISVDGQLGKDLSISGWNDRPTYNTDTETWESTDGDTPVFNVSKGVMCGNYQAGDLYYIGDICKYAKWNA